MKHAVIDIGSNTVSMAVYKRAEGGFIKLMSEKATAGLISYIENGRMSAEGVEALISVLEDFKAIAAAADVSEISCFATASLRFTVNNEEILRTVAERAGISVENISGEDEALLDYQGLKYSFPDADDGVFIDVGGGSTEIARFANGRITGLTSLPFGSLSLHNKFVSDIVPSKKERERTMKFIERAVDGIEWLDGGCRAGYLIGGTGRALAKAHMLTRCRKEALNGYMISFADINGMCGKERRQLLYAALRTSPERIHTILPGLYIIRHVLKRAGAGTAAVSAYGLREGYFISRVLNADEQ